MAKIIGISGSLVKSGVVEKGLEEVLKATGEEWEIIRTAKLNLKQCIGCSRCAKTNRCVLKDDMNEVLAKLEAADAIVVTGVARFGRLNSQTSLFFERMFPMFHNDVLENKLVASVAGGVVDQNTVLNDLSSYYKTYKMKEVGAVALDGNASCYQCGKGETCEKSVFRMKFGDDQKITPEVFYRFENDEKAIRQAEELGRALGAALV